MGLLALHKENPTWLPLGFPRIVIFEKSMREAFLRAIAQPLANVESESVPFYDDDVHGADRDHAQWKMAMLTDTTFKYFAHSDLYLCMTSVFCTTLRRWRPICVSVMSGISTNDYLQHFTTLFEAIPDEFVMDLQSIATSVVDFSEAQLNGFLEAYVNRKLAWARMMPTVRKQSLQYADVNSIMNSLSLGLHATWPLFLTGKLMYFVITQANSFM
eukprot:Opistho-2@92111